MTDLVPVRRALISLSQKSGLDELAAGLARHGVEIVSTGGTAATFVKAAPWYEKLVNSRASPR